MQVTLSHMKYGAFVLCKSKYLTFSFEMTVYKDISLYITFIKFPQIGSLKRVSLLLDSSANVQGVSGDIVSQMC